MSPERSSRRGTMLLLPFLLIGLLTSIAHADPGDTASYRLFDEYLWTWNGTQSRWADFPDSGVRHEKILMHFRLKCPTGGCGEWDYTMMVRAVEYTGRIDSSLKSFPSFRIDGQQRDSVPICFDTTWVYSWNTSASRLDSTASTPLRLTLYNNPTDPSLATDSSVVWPAGYFNPVFNASGVRVDSIYVAPDSILRVTMREAWVKFEVTVQYELGRFITPYGKWFAKDREFDWVYDVTDYASLLTDSTEIRVTYDGWSQGSLFTLDFEFIEGVPARDVYRVELLHLAGVTYGDPNNPIESKIPARTVTIDPNSRHTNLSITTSGHGFGGTENAAEFSDKTHWVEVNGVRRFDQHLWRDDCGQNPVYPQAGTWYYPRGGWCPGDIVHSFVYDLTPYVTPGQDAVIDYKFEPYTNFQPEHPASYYVAAVVYYSGGPNLRNDVELMEVRRPTTEFRFKRMNPICGGAPPQIVIRNLGADTLKSVQVDYGINGSTSNRYSWSGRLQFLDTAVLTLPGIPLGSGAGVFTVTLSEPNGTADDRVSNNTISTQYSAPPVSSGKLYISVRADDFLDDPANTNGIYWEVVDLDGRQLYSRGGMTDRTIYRDTLLLADGCYQFVIYDNEIGDGLIPIRGTAGSYLLRDDKGRTIANGAASGNFLASFGNREVVSFVVSSATGIDQWPQSEPIRELFLWPNPTSGRITVDLSELPAGVVQTLRVFSSTGEQVLEVPIRSGQDTISIDMTGHPTGVYSVQTTGADSVWSRRFILEQRSE